MIDRLRLDDSAPRGDRRRRARDRRRSAIRSARWSACSAARTASLVGQVRIPLGVIAMIYEARPNVTVDAAALCLKSGNAVILRGGKEAARSNDALGALVRARARRGRASPKTRCKCCRLSVATRRRCSSASPGKIDLVHPARRRGPHPLRRRARARPGHPALQGRLPPLRRRGRRRRDGARASSRTASSSAPACATRSSASSFTRASPSALLARGRRALAKGLEIRGDASDARSSCREGRAASDDDYGNEFLAPILAVRVVGSFDEALDHIAHVRLGPHRGHLHAGLRARPALPARGRREHGPRQRVDALQRRRRARPRRRDRHLDDQAPRLRPDGPRRA